MKMRDYIELQKVFGDKPKRAKREIGLKDLMKFEEELHKFEEWKKSQKKEEKKEEKKGWWHKMSVTQKLVILMTTVPIGIMIELVILMKFATMIASMVTH